MAAINELGAIIMNITNSRMRIFIIPFLILFYTVCTGQSYFHKIIDSPNTYFTFTSNILILPDSGALIGFAKKDSQSFWSSKFSILKVNSNGDIVWQREFSTDTSIFGAYISFSNNGYILVTTSKHSPFSINNDASIVIIEIDNNGSTLWTNTYSFAGWGNYVKQMDNGDFVIIGAGSTAIPGGQKSVIMRLDSIGNIISYNKYDRDIVGSNQNGFVTKDGGAILYVSGVLLTKVDSMGNISWNTSWYNPALGYKAIETIDSCFIVIASIWPPQPRKVLLVKVNSLGDTLWTRTIGGVPSMGLASIIQLDDGGYGICGNITLDTIAGTGQVLLIKTDSLANILWSKAYTVNDNSSEGGRDLSVSLDGGFVILGLSYDTILQIQSGLIIKTDSLGNSNCINYNVNVNNVSMPLLTTVPFNVIKTPLNISTSTTSIYNTIDNLYLTDTCISTVSINENVELYKQVLVYPNPFNNELTITCNSSENLEIEIYDIEGRKVFNQTFKRSIILNTTIFSEGLYIYKIIDNKSNLWVGKLVK
jgi:type IX secretion system substrate protein